MASKPDLTGADLKSRAASVINRRIPPLYTGDVKSHAALPLKTQFLYAKLKSLPQTATDTQRRKVYESALSDIKSKSEKELQSIIAAYKATTGTVDQLRKRGFVQIYDLSIPSQREAATPHVGKFVTDNPRGESVTKYWKEIQQLLPNETALSLKTNPNFMIEVEDKWKKWPIQNDVWDLSYEANRHWQACACEQPVSKYMGTPASSCGSLCKCYLLVLFYLLDSGEFHPIGMVYAFVSQDFQRMAIQGITASVALAFAKTLYPKTRLPIVNSFLIPAAINLARQLGMTALYVNPLLHQKIILREHYGFELVNDDPLTSEQGSALFGTACHLISTGKVLRRIREESATASASAAAQGGFIDRLF
jgi:hypothetical protein